MDKLLKKIDNLILKIPVHIRDLIQKGFYMILAIAGLIAIIYGIKKGVQNAEPGGAKLFQKSEDFFYLEKARDENRKKNKIIEDIEVYKDLFEARDERIHPTFRSLGKDTDDRLIGEKEEFLKSPDKLRKKEDQFLIEDDKSLEYEKPLPDSGQIRKKSEDTPFIENQENSTQNNTYNDSSKSEPSGKPDKSRGLDFIE